MAQRTQNLPVDGHVHFHFESAVGPTLDAAEGHFRAVADRREGLSGAILLTQTSREAVFEALRDTPRVGGWSIRPARNESMSLVATRGRSSLAIVCGRQVRAVDGLEVLALGTLETFQDGLPFEATLERVLRAGALPVIPWGFGKWLGARGRRVEAAIATRGPRSIFLGDNGSRLEWLGRPRMLDEAARQGFRLLPGTDPFPFAGGYRRVGGFGFLATIEPSPEAPWGDLRSWLLSRSESPASYGGATGPVRFVLNQVGIQVYNRRARGRAG
jgi:hypothetical protein